MKEMTGHDSVRRALQRFRRRRQAVVFWRAVLPLVSVSLAVVIVWAVATGANVDSASDLAGAAGLAVAAATAITWWRRPTHIATAAEIDRSLNSADSITAALALSADRDAVAALVIRDAHRHLSSTTPANVFPLRLQPYALASLLVLSAAAALLTVSDTRRNESTRTEGAGLMVQADGTAGVEHVPIAETVDRNAITASKAAPAGNAPIPASDLPPMTGGPSDAALSSAAGLNDPDTVSTDSTSPSESAATGRTKMPPSGRSGSGGEAVSTDGSGSARAATSSVAEPGARSASAAGHAPAAAAGESADVGHASGGVARGALGGVDARGAAQGGPPGSVPRGERTSARPVGDWTRSEVPPGLRQYVSDYFARVRALTGEKR